MRKLALLSIFLALPLLLMAQQPSSLTVQGYQDTTLLGSRNQGIFKIVCSTNLTCTFSNSGLNIVAAGAPAGTLTGALTASRIPRATAATVLGDGSMSDNATAISVLTGRTFAIADMTPGSIFFAGAGGLLAQANANLFWDNTAKKLNIKNRVDLVSTTVDQTVLFIHATDIDGSSAISVDYDESTPSAFPTSVSFGMSLTPASGNIGTVKNLYIGTNKSGAGTADSLADILLEASSISGGAVTDQYGMVIGDKSGATNNYAIKTGTGKITKVNGSDTVFEIADTGSTLIASASPLVLEGATQDGFETTVAVTDPSADRTLTIPNADSVTVQPDTGASNNFLTAVSAAGVISKAQPSAANLSNGTTGSGAVVLATAPAFVTSITAPLYASTTNCSDSAGAAACAAAPAGSFVIDAASTATVVSTTAVTANSQIFLIEDSSLGTRLGVTCNTQSILVLGAPVVTARTAATSFTATIVVGPTTNPMCVSYFIIN